MEVALFPLSNMIHLPGTNRPLNIFEPRYVKMVEESLENGRPIALCQGMLSTQTSKHGVLPIEHDHYQGVDRLSGAGIPILLKRLEDQTMLILLTGEYSVEIEEIIPSEGPFLLANATIREENRKLDAHYEFMYQRMRSMLMQKLDRLVSHASERERIRSELHSPTRLIAYYCELMMPKKCVKEKILELTDVNEKIAYLAELNLKACLTSGPLQ